MSNMTTANVLTDVLSYETSSKLELRYLVLFPDQAPIIPYGTSPFIPDWLGQLFRLPPDNCGGAAAPWGRICCWSPESTQGISFLLRSGLFMGDWEALLGFCFFTVTTSAHFCLWFYSPPSPAATNVKDTMDKSKGLHSKLHFH